MNRQYIGATSIEVYRAAIVNDGDMTKGQAKTLAAKHRASEPDDDLVTIVRTFDDILPFANMKSNWVTNPSLLVASKETIELMRSKAGHALFIDGTHAMTEGACQTVTFTIVVDGHGIGTAYGITRAKTHEAYAMLFNQLKQIVGNESLVKHVVLDGEDALHSAVRATWPFADIHVCMFHHLEAIRRWFQQHRGFEQVSHSLIHSFTHSLTHSLSIIRSRA